MLSELFSVCIQTLCCWVCGEGGLCHGSVELSRQREAPALPEVGGLNPTGSWRGWEAQLNSRCFWFFHRKSSLSRAASRSLSCTKFVERQTSCSEQKPFYGRQECVCIFIHYMQFKHERVRCPSLSSLHPRWCPQQLDWYQCQEAHVLCCLSLTHVWTSKWILTK